jgi:formylglycine-generating enzyme required for sulfatase activity
MRRLIPFALALTLVPAAHAGDAIPVGNLSIDVVTVGDPGNLGDSNFFDFGSVADDYRIGEFEIKNVQYVQFLNAVARVTDDHGLYNTNMGAGSPAGGIFRAFSEPPDDAYPFIYVVKTRTVETWPRPAEKPVNFVSWFDAARFVNWLENGAPEDANNDPDSVTEMGSYDVFEYELAYEMAVQDPDPMMDLPMPEPGASWALPTIDEWHKAAYYDPTIPTTGGYWDYPVQDDAVECENPAGGATSANCERPISGGGFPNLLNEGPTEVGAYTQAPSFYGSFDQGGNVREWTEDVFVFDDFRGSGLASLNRGGSYSSERTELRSDDSSLLPLTGSFAEDDPGEEGGGRTGFRVVFLPEPGLHVAQATALLSIALVAALARRRAVRA